MLLHRSTSVNPKHSEQTCSPLRTTRVEKKLTMHTQSFYLPLYFEVTKSKMSHQLSIKFLSRLLANIKKIEERAALLDKAHTIVSFALIFRGTQIKIFSKYKFGHQSLIKFLPRSLANIIKFEERVALLDNADTIDSCRQHGSNNMTANIH